MNEFLVVNWNLGASKRFKKIYDEILKDSFINAENVKKEISAIIDKLPEYPERYGLDKWKRDNPGNYRAFEKYSYRITYRHTDTEVRILRIRHVKQEPRMYE